MSKSFKTETHVLQKERNSENGQGDSDPEKFEEGTVVGVDKIKSDTYRVQFLMKTGFIQVSLTF